ncbi:hypothetical protein ACCE85_003963 [Photobacterium damselae]
MSATDNKGLQGLKNLQLNVTGKVLRARNYDGMIYTTVICPAKDAYSRPSIVEIRSKSRLGAQVDEEIKGVLCELSGFEGKAYRVTDRDTGEQRQIKPVNHFLDLVEA